MTETGPNTAAVKEIPVSVYFVWQWWEKYYQQAHGRPDAIDFDWLDQHYCGRQRYLFEQFGQFGVGQEHPELDKTFVGKLLPFHTILVPVLLGVQTSIQNHGGYAWQNRTEEDIAKLKPVDLANSPVGELIIRECEHRLARYGIVTQMVDLASPTNNAFTLRGPEFYADLIADEVLARHTLDVVTETMTLAYRFLTEQIGPMQGFSLANCNVTMVSPELYEKMILEYDIRCVEFASRLTGKSPCCDIHHCNVKTEPFATAYGNIPGLRSLQGSALSDIRKIKQNLPNVTFSAMINPADLLVKSPDQVEQEIDQCLTAGANDLAIWDIDPVYRPQDVQILFRRIETVCRRHDLKAEISIIPYAWEELDWEFSTYREGKNPMA